MSGAAAANAPRAATGAAAERSTFALPQAVSRAIMNIQGIILGLSSAFMREIPSKLRTNPARFFGSVG